MIAAARSGLRGIHVLWMMLAFFGAVIAINVGFIFAALDTFPGEDVRRSYLQGLHYNQAIAERRQQAALGWRATASLAPDADGAALTVRIADRAGAAIETLDLSGALRRPVNAGQDRTLTFVHIGGGEYRARLAGLAPGAWELRAQARYGDAKFDIARRFTWRPSASQ